MKRLTKKIAQEYLLLLKYDDGNAAYNYYLEHEEYFKIDNLFIKYCSSTLYGDRRDDRICYFKNSKYLKAQAKYTFLGIS